MDEYALLLLGILKTQSQHGYRINEFVEKNFSRVTDMKKARAYAILDRLEKAGYVAAQTEQEGNRPPRKVYAITPAGEKQFTKLLRESLSRSPQMTLTGDVGLMFLNELPQAEVLACLTQRLGSLETQITALENVPQHEQRAGVDLALEHLGGLLRADREWLMSVLRRLQNNA